MLSMANIDFAATGLAISSSYIAGLGFESRLLLYLQMAYVAPAPIARIPTTLTTAAMMIVVEPPDLLSPFGLSKGSTEDEVLAEGRGVGAGVGDRFTAVTSPACAPAYPKLVLSTELNDFEVTAVLKRLVTAVVLATGTIMT